MNWKTWIPLGLAVVLGLFAMKIAHDVMSKKDADANKHETQIVILNKELPAGSTIGAADLGSKKVAEEAILPGAITNAAEAEGRVLVAAGTKESPLLQSMLAPKGVGGGLQAVIPEGMRAITIEINEFSGVAGNLVPGCRVDVISTLAGEAGGEMITRTVVQNVKIQALGMRRVVEGDQGQAGPVRSVTMVATPQEAEAIELAAVAGRAHLLLRSTGDSEKPLSEGVSLSYLRGKAAPTIGIDPFGSVQNTALKGNKNPLSTTQPSDGLVGGQPFNAEGFRQIQVIRGTTVSRVTVEDPQPKELAPEKHLMTNADTTELPVNNDNK